MGALSIKVNIKLKQAWKPVTTDVYSWSLFMNYTRGKQIHTQEPHECSLRLWDGRSREGRQGVMLLMDSCLVTVVMFSQLANSLDSLLIGRTRQAMKNLLVQSTNSEIPLLYISHFQSFDELSYLFLKITFSLLF